MATKIYWLAIRLALIALLLSSSAALAQVAPLEKLVTLILPAGSELSAGVYDVVISLPDGQRVEAQVRLPESPAGAAPASAAQPGAAQPGAPASGEAAQPAAQDSSGAAGQAPAPTQAVPAPAAQSNTVMIVLAALIPTALIGAGLLLYFKVIQPRRNLAPYLEAVASLKNQQYDQALPVLSKVEGRLPDAQRKQARFFIAFAQFRQGQYPDAIRTLKALHREEPGDAAAAYFLAYCLLKESGNDQEAEKVLEEMEKSGQLSYRDARKLLGQVKFRRALAALKDGRVDAAEDLFEKVVQLGDYAGKVPADLRNRQITVGTQALFDKNVAEARAHFQRVLEAGAGGQPPEAHLLASACLGLALANWIEGSGWEELESLCVKAIQALDPKASLELTWPEELTVKDLLEQLKDLERGENGRHPEARRVARFLRDVHFLRAMAVLKAWGNIPGKEANQLAPAMLERILKRLACARQQDESFSDAYLVAGLLLFYLFEGEQRERGVELLQIAQKQGMRQPDALEIINNRNKLREANASAIESYLLLLDRYISNPSVRGEVRQQLLAELRRYQRIQAWEKAHDFSRLQSLEPTLNDIRDRSEMLIARVDQILSAGAQARPVDQIRRLRAQLQEGGQRLVSQAQEIEKDEASLMLEIGSQLLKEA